MKILFLCRGNIGRSVFASHLYNKITGTSNAFSAGTVVDIEQTLKDIHSKVQNVIDVMKEENIDVSSHLRQQVTEVMMQSADVVVDMAEPETVPDFVKNHPNKILWEVDNPKGTDLETHRRIKNEIKNKIEEYISNNQDITFPIQPHLLAQGNYKPENIVISVNPSTLVLTSDIQEQIDQIWGAKIQEAQDKGLNLYNETSYRLNSIKEDNGKLYLDFGLMEYKTRYGLRQLLPNMKVSQALYRNGCFIGATVKTSDDKYLMVELSGKSMNTNKYDVLGGMMETNIPIDENYIFNVLKQELQEEGSISEKDIDEMILKAVYQGAYTNVGFYAEVTLNISSDEVLQRNTNNQDVDITSILVLSREEYLATIQNHNLNKQFIYQIVVKS